MTCSGNGKEEDGWNVEDEEWAPLETPVPSNNPQTTATSSLAMETKVQPSQLAPAPSIQTRSITSYDWDSTSITVIMRSYSER